MTRGLGSVGVPALVVLAVVSGMVAVWWIVAMTQAGSPGQMLAAAAVCVVNALVAATSVAAIRWHRPSGPSTPP
ncbi:MAG: hypothetical protein GY788_32905 [bacterium]|nr:hypothetical protein [bacterium]